MKYLQSNTNNDTLSDKTYIGLNKTLRRKIINDCTCQIIIFTELYIPLYEKLSLQLYMTLI